QVNYSFGILVHPGKELLITFNYDKQRHDHIQMQYMEGHWRSLLGLVIENPSICINDLEILSEREKDNVLHRFQGDTVEYPQEKTLVDLWQKQAEKTPDRMALSFEGNFLTYEELDQRSTVLANQLQHQCGIQLGDHIGLLMDRGIDLIVSLLGIMKAGGVYIPIDPSYPSERIEFIIQDAKCNLLIVENETDKKVHKYESGQILDIQDVDWTTDKRQEVHASSRNVAYMIYTSGSTGQPKGVMIEHRGFINMIQEQIRAFGLSEKDRVLQFASCGFDASLSEVFMALLSGACLVLVPEETIRDVQLLGSFLSRQAITVATFPPSYLRAINQMEIPGLRVMITAGETMIVGDARFYASRLRYFNAYGPTEASVCATYHEVEAEEIGNGPVAIGRPLVNTKIFILDSMLRPVPIGVIGELCIAGPGLASGYWNRLEENKKRFVRHPLANGEKLYRTGDLGRWLHTGCIEFLGRMDSQVKINGYRIEMAEVEKHIRGCPGVEQAVVQVMEQEGRDKSLVAYIVLSSRVKIDKLRTELRKFLPEFMVPKDIVFLDELPLTPNQKVDKSQLPDPRNIASEGQGYIAPRDLNEEQLAGIWEEVLGRRPVGIYNSFFDKGGHSLLAIQLVGRMEKAGFSIPLKVLYEYPTIAQVIEHANNNAQEHKSPIVSGTFHLTPVQRCFFQSRDEEHHHFNHYVLLKSIETVDADSLAKALYALWLHHDGLRSRFDLYSE
ncbi:MAG TPA: amino acid adenylation domain-containing protein, partial [Desulfohalobiaceae bacterium]|nr:amino acid adenylation domain-containing protein [Desulfohalobiaceae bacterium]